MPRSFVQHPARPPDTLTPPAPRATPRTQPQVLNDLAGRCRRTMVRYHAWPRWDTRAGGHFRGLRNIPRGPFDGGQTPQKTVSDANRLAVCGNQPVAPIRSCPSALASATPTVRIYCGQTKLLAAVSKSFLSAIASIAMQVMPGQKPCAGMKQVCPSFPSAGTLQVACRTLSRVRDTSRVRWYINVDESVCDGQKYVFGESCFCQGPVGPCAHLAQVLPAQHASRNLSRAVLDRCILSGSGRLYYLRDVTQLSGLTGPLPPSQRSSEQQ